MSSPHQLSHVIPIRANQRMGFVTSPTDDSNLLRFHEPKITPEVIGFDCDPFLKTEDGFQWLHQLGPAEVAVRLTTKLVRQADDARWAMHMAVIDLQPEEAEVLEKAGNAAVAAALFAMKLAMQHLTRRQAEGANMLQGYLLNGGER